MDNLIGVIPNELLVLIISMVPVIELRGAIPIAMGLGMSWWKAFTLSGSVYCCLFKAFV